MSESDYHPIEQPEEISMRDREDAMGAYFMMFAALAAGLPLPILNLVAAIIYYYVNRNKSRFVKFHSLQSLYSQIPTTLLNAGLVFWTLRMIFTDLRMEDNPDIGGVFATVGELYWGYLYVVIAGNVLYIVFSIVAAVKARKGRFYYMIFFGRLAYHAAYRKTETQEFSEQNLPPS